MPIPPDIANIIDRLDRELEKIEQNTREGLSISSHTKLITYI
jgi:hypothetical protein